MTKDSPEANDIGMTQFPSLSSMVDGNVLELVWKDGQILTSGRSMSPSCISFNSFHQFPTSQVNNDPYNNMHPNKKPKMGNVHSISGNLPGYHKLGSSLNPGIPSTSRNDQLHSEPKHHGSDQVSICGLNGSTIKKIGSGSNNQMGFQNFSLFLRPALFVKRYGQGGVAARPKSGPSSSRLEELKSSSNDKSAPVSDNSNHNPIESKIKDPGSGLDGSQSCHVDPMIANKTGFTSFALAKNEPFPGEQSEAVKKIHDMSSEKGFVQLPGRPESGKPVDQLTLSASVCSLGASNDINHSLRKIDGDSTDKHSEEEQEEWQVTKRDTKRKRTSQGHSLSEKKRREKINKRLRTLKELLPNSDKVDKASMLDEAIEHIKTLQLQIQIMSMGPGLYKYMPPMMMPNGLQNMQAPQLAYLPPMTVGLGVGMPGIGCSPVPLPNSPMLGLPGQVLLPMSMSCATSIPLTGGSAPQGQAVGPLGMPTELLGSAPSFISPKDGRSYR